MKEEHFVVHITVIACGDSRSFVPQCTFRSVTSLHRSFQQICSLGGDLNMLKGELETKCGFYFEFLLT